VIRHTSGHATNASLHPTPLVGAVLAVGMVIGFVVGQLAPSLTPITWDGGGPASAATRQLGLTDDYGTRLPAGAATVAIPLDAGADYALRHAPSSEASLSDHGTRHPGAAASP
jgi:hypothetical protein